jgi:putative Ca2+/H+ antiporter (TMEM165/GDT1 family)
MLTALWIFALMFVLELPDKTMFATVIMASRARARNVVVGAASAFTVHMGIAVGAGGLLKLLHPTPKSIIMAILFFGGAAYLLFVPEKEEEEEGEREGRAEKPGSTWREIGGAFSVIFIGEFGDLTQIQAANLAAKHNWAIVFFPSVAALAAIAVMGAYGGKWITSRLPLEWIRRAGGAIFAGLGIWTVIGLFHP